MGGWRRMDEWMGHRLINRWSEGERILTDRQTDY